MDDVRQLISGITQKLDQVTALRNEDRNEKIRLVEEVELQKRIVSEQKKTINELEDKIKILKITKSLEKGKENIDAKLKINEMLREIDKCIGMINS